MVSFAIFHVQLNVGWLWIRRKTTTRRKPLPGSCRSGSSMVTKFPNNKSHIKIRGSCGGQGWLFSKRKASKSISQINKNRKKKKSSTNTTTKKKGGNNPFFYLSRHIWSDNCKILFHSSSH